ncbi:excinuclease ABC subunit UvrA [Streptobacillus felis]|uniref:UvrABC system protein A n=1 Tax=Streptobacillus felis TaxID=1384509 RepID=A0A7Z0PDW9_9FUSO|nr:excinuclease ABC subunit UvrA [Streptobacillus felis]NYV27431.1 excinuclease ABC subunit UvrA [Streptobacillus felis]
MEYIKIRGAREHNLKNIDIDIPKNKFVVITGVSGSGKSSLAFETIYSEGQRRYVESLSAYARQFIGQMKKPELDSIEGLSPAISIEQKSVSKNPRSTVGTMTEIYDYMRLLWGHIGNAHCPICNTLVKKQSIEEITNEVFSRCSEKDKLMFLSPLVVDKKGSFKNLFINLSKQGYLRARVDAVIYELDDTIELDKNKRHSIELITDRIVFKEENISRINEAIVNATKLSEGNLIVNINGVDHKYSENFVCSNHPEISFPEINPRLFSFNAPYGACEECNGLGSSLEVNMDAILLNDELSINEGALSIVGGSSPTSWTWKLFMAFLEGHNIDPNIPFKNLKDYEKNLIFYGSDKEYHFAIHTKEYNYDGFRTFEGLINLVKRRHKESMSESNREEIQNRYMIETKCSKCAGKRLNDTVLSITINDKSIIDVTNMSIVNSLEFFENLKLTDKEKQIAEEILKEIKNRLSFLINVGLDYLSLDRMTKTLSGGESQRIRLATQIGSRLTGVIYVLDEPSIGLHQRDNDKLLKTLKDLKNIGNTLIVVEHDEDTMIESDFLIDIGPGAGKFGGEIIASGTPADIINDGKTLTAKYLNKEIQINKTQKIRKSNEYLKINNCTGNNLKNVNLKIPLGIFTVVTGVSGSGKSSLINQTLYPILHNRLNEKTLFPLSHGKVEGIDNVKKVINIDQSPIGRTPRSNTATYTKIFDDIRGLFSETNDAKIRGFDKGRFSFNVKGGRCETCSGAGINKIEMNFLPDVYVECEMCKGKRYNKETLEVKYKGKNISEVLDMSVIDAFEFFEAIPSLKRKLQTLIDVGMDYISLGQPATTLSGGEAQRIKLASELSKVAKEGTMYILDEPTTGLHFEDVRKLLIVLDRLVSKGNSVVVIEHNLDVIKCADYIIDIGLEGGDKGGYIVVEGTPDKIMKHKDSYTGKFLKKHINK